MNLKKNVLKAGLCFNLKDASRSDDSDEEYDSIETIEFLEAQLASFGFKVVRMEQNEDLLKTLAQEKPDYVFNIAEGKGTSRSRESQVPCLLDWLKIPYYGSDGVSLALTLDKLLANICLKNAGVPVAEMFCISEIDRADGLKKMFDGRSYIVKPRWEGSSKGIFNDSVTDNIPKCLKLAERIINDYKQPAVVEEFLPNEEITVAVIGNNPPIVLGMMCISQKEPVEKFVYSIENKRSWRETIVYKAAKEVIPASLVSQLEKSALNAFKVLELRDAARIDFRIDAKGIGRIIDINPLPGLSPEYSDMMIISGLHDLRFSEVVRTIMELSLKRNNLIG